MIVEIHINILINENFSTRFSTAVCPDFNNSLMDTAAEFAFAEAYIPGFEAALAKVWGPSPIAAKLLLNGARN